MTIEEIEIGMSVIWPNGFVGPIKAIDDSDEKAMDEAGAWHKVEYLYPAERE